MGYLHWADGTKRIALGIENLRGVERRQPEEIRAAELTGADLAGFPTRQQDPAIVEQSCGESDPITDHMRCERPEGVVRGVKDLRRFVSDVTAGHAAAPAAGDENLAILQQRRAMRLARHAHR